jgi:hypothetical protein
MVRVGPQRHRKGRRIRRKKKEYLALFVKLICRWKVLVFHAFILCLAEDGDLSPKHAAESMYVDDI